MNRDITLRDAIDADVPAIARLHVVTFDQTHGPGPTSELRERQWQAAFASPADMWFCIVLETHTAELIGFAKGKSHTGKELSEFRGELNKIYLLRQYHRRGLGRQLLCGAATRFIERGVNSMLLFGDARSPTNGFYETMGAERLHAATGEFHGGYGWKNLAMLVARCSAEGENSR